MFLGRRYSSSAPVVSLIRFCKSEIRDQRSEIAFKLIANLPYNIASPLLINLAVDYPGMQRAVVMVQKEVADRLAAAPGGKDYGPMSVIVQALCEVAEKRKSGLAAADLREIILNRRALRNYILALMLP